MIKKALKSVAAYYFHRGFHNKPNISMESAKTSKLSEKRVSKIESSKRTRVLKRFYSQFLDLLARKTDAEKRIELYGKDPFK